MTVISKTQTPRQFPSSNANSDTESLHLGSTTSDAESVHNEPLHRLFQPRGRSQCLKLGESLVVNKHSGKRKLRRYQNGTCLNALNEEENENEMFDLFESLSPLSKLLENPEALHYWNEFMDKPEEEQQQLINDLENKRECKTSETTKTEKPFSRISSKIRRFLKIKKNLHVETIKSFEDEVIDFFNSSPHDRYIKYPPTSFERLLTHAVAQYHCLHSFSQWDNDKRKVEVLNLKSNWTPSPYYLYEMVNELRI